MGGRDDGIHANNPSGSPVADAASPPLGKVIRSGAFKACTRLSGVGKYDHFIDRKLKEFVGTECGGGLSSSRRS